jgi:hypothetical protein
MADLIERPTIDNVDLYADMLQQRSFAHPDRDALLDGAAKYLRYLVRRVAALESGTALATEREAREKAEAGHAAARQNFHTMQLAADALRKSLAEARRLLKAMLSNPDKTSREQARAFLAQEPNDER